MGQVWAGRLRGARGFQKLVAVKTLLSLSEDSERMERMLFEEARIAGLIQHSNVVQTMELGEHDGALYLVMEWVDGEPLSYLLKCCEERVMPLPVAVNLIAQTLSGLQAAHELRDDSGAPLGVVHRDVSPHNVLVSYAGVAKLVDFGIAKAMNQQSSETSTGEIKGKFAYMAPEQILNAEVDQRADLFSVGIMLYLLSCGRHPFKNAHTVGVLHSITSEEQAPRPSLLKPGYSRTLEAVVLKALAKDRDERWASAAEMRAALQRAVPEAFEVGIEAQLYAFMNEVAGERAAHKREALRRAELRSSRNNSSGSALAAASATAQSGSSLGAVSVDTSDSQEAEPAPRLSFLPTDRPPSELTDSPFPKRRAVLLASAAAFGLLLTLVLFKKPTVAGRDARSANASVSVQLLSAQPAPLSPTPPPAVSTTEQSRTPGAPGSAVITTQNTPHVGTPAAPGAKLPKTQKARPKPRAALPPSDLIAPDYAR